MKLSEYQGEAALDVLADLIEPAGEIMSDKEIGDVFKKNRFKAIGLAIKNHKKAVIQIMATMDGVPVDEYKCNVFTLPVKILELLNELSSQQGNSLSILFICHDISLVQQFCDRVLVMYHGGIVEEGTPDEVIQHPRNAYTQRLIDSVL